MVSIFYPMVKYERLFTEPAVEGSIASPTAIMSPTAATKAPTTVSVAGVAEVEGDEEGGAVAKTTVEVATNTELLPSTRSVAIGTDVVSTASMGTNTDKELNVMEKKRKKSEVGKKKTSPSALPQPSLFTVGAGAATLPSAAAKSEYTFLFTSFFLYVKCKHNITNNVT